MRKPTVSVWTVCAGLIGAACLLLEAGPARAHELLDQAKVQSERAEFERALLTLAKAESEAVLSRDDVIELYLQRALIHFALRLPAAMAADLELVATLEPTLELDDSLPPDVREAFPTHAEGLSLQVSATPEEAHVRLRLLTRGLRTDLVKGVKLSARAEHGEWQTQERDELLVPAAPGATVEYYAVAHGPGGAELVALGSWANPERVTPAPPAAMGADGGSSDLGWWIVGGVAVAAIATTLGIVFATASDDTQLSAPQVQR